MAQKLIVTNDGSHTLETRDGVTYHSQFGAIQESQHIFIAAGLRVTHRSPLRVFEMGFGTGLNAFLTLLEGRPVHYETVETEPLSLALPGSRREPSWLLIAVRAPSGGPYRPWGSKQRSCRGQRGKERFCAPASLLKQKSDLRSGGHGPLRQT